MRKADMAFLNENGVIPSLLKCDERCQGATARVGVYLEYGLNDTRVRYTEGLRLYLALKEKRIGRSVVGLFFPERGHLRGDQYDDAEALIDGVRVEWILRHLEIGGA